MKFLRNPWVVGALAVIAVVTVFVQLFQPQIKRWYARVSSTTGNAAAVANKSGIGQPFVPASSAHPASGAAAKTSSVSAPAPKVSGNRRAKIDADYVTSHFVEWVDSPGRDPFLIASGYVASTNGLPEGPNPVPTWKLSGIWRQTGEQLAAINGGVYGEGDVIEGWKVEKIDVDRVWFRGPTNRLEVLQFHQFQAVQPAVPVPTPTRRLGPKPRPMQEHTVGPEL